MEHPGLPRLRRVIALWNSLSPAKRKEKWPGLDRKAPLFYNFPWALLSPEKRLDVMTLDRRQETAEREVAAAQEYRRQRREAAAYGVAVDELPLQ